MDTKAKSLIALTWSAQSGKTELAHVFNSVDWCKFVNLNEYGYKIRQANSPDRAFYDWLIPWCLRDDGKYKIEYYLRLLQDWSIIDRIIGFEVPRIKEKIDLLLDTQCSWWTLVLSWEYWNMVLSDISPTSLMILDCVDKNVWFNRLRARIASRWYVWDFISDETLEAMMRSAKFHPNQLITEVRKVIPNSQITMIDTSDYWACEGVIRDEVLRLIK